MTAFCWSTVQMSEGGDVERTRKLSLSGRAIRHCASSLVSSARQIASERQHWTSYRAYAEHSRALSRALTHLVRFLRYVRASACATHAETPLRYCDMDTFLPRDAMHPRY